MTLTLNGVNLEDPAGRWSIVTWATPGTHTHLEGTIQPGSLAALQTPVGGYPYIVVENGATVLTGHRPDLWHVRQRHRDPDSAVLPLRCGLYGSSSGLEQADRRLDGRRRPDGPWCRGRLPAGVLDRPDAR